MKKFILKGVEVKFNAYDNYVGVSEDMVRLSMGIERIDDIIADIEQAWKAALLT